MGNLWKIRDTWKLKVSINRFFGKSTRQRHPPYIFNLCSFDRENNERSTAASLTLRTRVSRFTGAQVLWSRENVAKPRQELFTSSKWIQESREFSSFKILPSLFVFLLFSFRKSLLRSFHVSRIWFSNVERVSHQWLD